MRNKKTTKKKGHRAILQQLRHDDGFDDAAVSAADDKELKTYSGFT